MVISAVARAAAKILVRNKILAKQKYAKTARVWRKKNPDIIKAQKKRYYAAHKTQLIKEQKLWRKDNPEKARQLVLAAKTRQPKKIAPKPTQKPTPGIYAVWTREQKSKSGFSAFLKGLGKSKAPVPLVKKSHMVRGLQTVEWVKPFGYARRIRVRGLQTVEWVVPKKRLGRKPKFLGFGGILGGLASYTFWNRGKK